MLFEDMKKKTELERGEERVRQCSETLIAHDNCVVQII